MSVSKALENATNYDTRWTSDRVERRLDDRDNLLSEALYNLENRTVTISGDATGTGVVDSNGDVDVGVTLNGSTFTELASLGDLDVDGDTTLAGDLTFDGVSDQSIIGPATGSISLMAGASDQAVKIGVTGYGTMIEIDSANMGFFTHSPVGQPSSFGETVGVTVGSGATLTDEATFTGGVGTTAYTISDIVKHLKNLGLIAQ